MILQRPIERAQMQKLLETGKTDLLQFVSARTRRPFSAFLVKQADGKVGFEFEAKEPGRKGARGATRSAPLRVLGTHPRDRQPVELHAGRYGPYVKHGTTNATLPDKDAVDSLSLDEAVALVDEKAGRSPTRSTRRTVKTRAPRKMTPGVAERPAATAARRARATGNGAAATDVGTTIRSTVKSGAATARSSVRKSAAKTLAVKKTATKTTTGKKAVTKRRAAAPPEKTPPRTVAKTKRGSARTRK